MRRRKTGIVTNRCTKIAQISKRVPSVTKNKATVEPSTLDLTKDDESSTNNENSSSESLIKRLIDGTESDYSDIPSVTPIEMIRDELASYQVGHPKDRYVNIVGNRATGKTVLIHMLQNVQVESANIVPMRILKQRTTAKSYYQIFRLCRNVGEAIPVKLVEPNWERMPKELETFSSAEFIELMADSCFAFTIIVTTNRLTASEYMLCKQLSKANRKFCIVRTKCDEIAEVSPNNCSTEQAMAIREKAVMKLKYEFSCYAEYHLPKGTPIFYTGVPVARYDIQEIKQYILDNMSGV